MNRSENARVLLRALTNVNDQYIREAAAHAADQDAADQDAPGKNIADHRKPAAAGGKKIIFHSRMMKQAAAIAACFAAVFFAYIGMHGIGKPETGGDNAAADAPNQEVADIEKAAEITGFTLTAPAAKDPFTKETVTVIDRTMIETAYSTEDETDTGYAIRKAKGVRDISGDYTDYPETAEETVNGTKITLKGNNGKWSLATWTKKGYSYAIESQNHPMAKDVIISLAAGTR